MGNSQGKPADISGETSLNHFRLLRVVGRGAFGKVRIVERKDTGLTFALKYIRKDEVIKSESVRNIIRERRMLEHVSHPFLCNLRYSFQDVEYMYLVVDLMSGGDLRFHIARKTFTEEAVQFWIAELGCALKYIHGQNIIHRDVKPDNVLLDAEGHVHLTDFNVATDVIPGKLVSSKSGTLAYLAPEVYAGNGYDIRADWWSLGVLFYECIYNKRPFDGNSESILSQQIQAGIARFPMTQPPVSAPCLQAIRAALELKPSARMGSTWESFIHNDYFRSIDFEALEAKQIEPIFVPSSEKTNFDATYDLEELLLEEAPLEARARRQKPRERLKEDATDQEIREYELHQMIEAEFRPYDYTVVAYQLLTRAQGIESDELKKPIPDSLLAKHESLMSAHPVRHSVPVNPSTNGGPISKIPSASHPPLNEKHSGAHPPTFGSSVHHRLHHLTSSKKGLPGSPGGVPFKLDGSESWSDIARQDTTLPKDAAHTAVVTDSHGKHEGSGGVFGFLKHKKHRNNSPKPSERGVLGKEGARVVVS